MLIGKEKKSQDSKKEMHYWSRLSQEGCHQTHHEALHSPIVRVQQQACHRAHLGSPVPAVRTVDKHTCPFL